AGSTPVAKTLSNPSAVRTLVPMSLSVSPLSDANCNARYTAPRNMLTKMESLKCPACKAASCRLSVKPSNLRLFTAILPACSCIQRTTLDVNSVVAELRPSADNAASLLLSLPCAPWLSPQFTHSRNLPGKNHAGAPEPSWPSGDTVMD